jgi:hypothetical protein
VGRVGGLGGFARILWLNRRGPGQPGILGWPLTLPSDYRHHDLDRDRDTHDYPRQEFCAVHRTYSFGCARQIILAGVSVLAPAYSRVNYRRYTP